MPRTARKQGKTGVYYITLHNSKSHTENRPLYDMIKEIVAVLEIVIEFVGEKGETEDDKRGFIN